MTGCPCEHSADASETNCLLTSSLCFSYMATGSTPSEGNGPGRWWTDLSGRGFEKSRNIFEQRSDRLRQTAAYIARWTVAELFDLSCIVFFFCCSLWLRNCIVINFPLLALGCQVTKMSPYVSTNGLWYRMSFQNNGNLDINKSKPPFNWPQNNTSHCSYRGNLY